MVLIGSLFLEPTPWKQMAFQFAYALLPAPKSTQIITFALYLYYRTVFNWFTGCYTPQGVILHRLLYSIGCFTAGENLFLPVKSTVTPIFFSALFFFLLLFLVANIEDRNLYTMVVSGVFGRTLSHACRRFEVINRRELLARFIQISLTDSSVARSAC